MSIETTNPLTIRNDDGDLASFTPYGDGFMIHAQGGDDMVDVLLTSSETDLVAAHLLGVPDDFDVTERIGTVSTVELSFSDQPTAFVLFGSTGLLFRDSDQIRGLAAHLIKVAGDLDALIETQA